MEEHALLHKKLWEEHGDYRDRIAYHALSGMIGKDEILKQIFHENGKKAGALTKGRPAWNKGKTGIYSESSLKKMSNSRKGKPRTLESRIKQSKTMKGVSYGPKSKSHRENLSKANAGKRWFTNESLKISKQFNVPFESDEWKLGRKYGKEGVLMNYVPWNKKTDIAIHYLSI